jgi:hypothetical protein
MEGKNAHYLSITMVDPTDSQSYSQIRQILNQSLTVKAQKASNEFPKSLIQTTPEEQKGDSDKKVMQPRLFFKMSHNTVIYALVNTWGAYT